MDSSKARHDVFQAIADPTRRQLLKLLANNELPISKITKQFPISRTAVNKHLQILLESGLVSNNRVGRENRFKLNPQPLIELKDWLTFFEQYWDERLLALKALVEKNDNEE
ncbi:ArsR/SmtB family transcription factor [Rummeliibacillus pycnus]|uniref:ArsR/SmtB family transcription factor n=1 Tax=Rummeliibacillus pycnus TaxID=101070 RepID=UPI000C9B6302|nr:metalloregulator ArsR/SmtB family transcription factor [Rummeliibacillus pycnus]